MNPVRITKPTSRSNAKSSAEPKHRKRFDWARATAHLGIIERNLLHGAARGDLKIVKKAFSEGADVNVVGILEMTALEIARKHGHEHVVEFLKRNGAVERGTKAGSQEGRQ